MNVPSAPVLHAPPAALPAGTITFLFTDIEGSTRLWEETPDGMRAALARHDALLRAEIERHRGYVFKTVGDAFCAAFDTATDALAAAVAAQRAIEAEAWAVLLGEDRRIRVRMALHTGDAQERDGDYFGPSLNRVARLLGAGHGGQVLLSLPTEELVRDSLPGGITLRDLGERRLKDLIRPEWIFQLCVPGLQDAFPPLRTLDGRRHNLPVQPTPLVGRERELEEVRRRLRASGTRLLTLTGPGGTGKTRLSLQAAAELLDEFEHGVFFVPLASITDPALVLPAMARAVGVPEEGETSPASALAAFLREKQLLLVLDNFEQLLVTPDAGAVVAELLEGAPRVKALVSSRAPLRVYGEREYPVPPLSLPDPARLPALERLPEYEAVRLFLDRATDVRPDFRITRENAPAVVEICQRLDGLPLAIELAAARVKLLSPPQLLARLEKPLQLLTAGARNLPPRQQTLRNLIAWSYDLLAPGEQALFRRLAAFSGGWTMEAAEAVVAGTGESLPVVDDLDLLEGLESLVEKSLVRRVEDAASAKGGEEDLRFTFLETVHAFATEALETAGEAHDARARHAAHFLALAEGGAQELYGREQLRWLERFETEHGNLRAALDWLLAGGGSESALRLAAALGGFWRVRGYLREGRQRLERVFDSLGAVAPSEPLAYALGTAGTLAAMLGDAPAARLFMERSLAAWRVLGNERRTAGVLLNLGTLAFRLGDYDAAREVLEEALAVQRKLGIKAGMALTLNNLGLLLREQGDPEAARAALEQSLALKRELGDVRAVPSALVSLGELLLDSGDLARAAQYLSQCLTAVRDLGDPRASAHALEATSRLASAHRVPEKVLLFASAASALRERTGAAAPQADARRLQDAHCAAAEMVPGSVREDVERAGREADLEEITSSALTWVASLSG